MSSDCLSLASFIGIARLLSAINIGTTDGVVFDIMTLYETPSVLMNLLRSRCVVVLVKYLKVLATCRKYGTRQA